MFKNLGEIILKKVLINTAKHSQNIVVVLL